MNMELDWINEFSDTDSDSRGLDILLEIQQSSTRRNAFTQLAIARLLDSNLAAKYAITGRLGNILLLPHPFPLLCGAMFLMRRLHLTRSCAFSPDRPLFNKSFLMLSNHHSFGLPLLLFSGTSITITLSPTFLCLHLGNNVSRYFVDDVLSWYLLLFVDVEFFAQ